MCVPDRPSLPGDDHGALCLYSAAAPGDALESSSACSSDCGSPCPAMSSAASSWGTLINPDKSPAPLLEQLCLGIAQLMVRPLFECGPMFDKPTVHMFILYVPVLMLVSRFPLTLAERPISRRRDLHLSIARLAGITTRYFSRQSRRPCRLYINLSDVSIVFVPRTIHMNRLQYPHFFHSGFCDGRQYRY